MKKRYRECLTGMLIYGKTQSSSLLQVQVNAYPKSSEREAGGAKFAKSVQQRISCVQSKVQS